MKIKIKYIEKSDSATVIENDNYIVLYLFNIIKIKKIKKKNKKNNSQIRSKKKKID